MDLNFGEIVEPVSRAFYDDYDDSSLNLPFKRFAHFFAVSRFHKIALCFRPIWLWNIEDGKPEESIQNFIIIEGHNALNVINPSILKNKSPIAKLDGHKVEIFKVGDFTICTVEEKDLNYFATITELLEPWTSVADTCTIVSLQSISDYKAEHCPESCFVRSINSKIGDFPPLEVPNFITGVGAGVGTSRKINDRTFSCFVVYVDIYDVLAIRTILNLLKHLELPHDESVVLKALHQKSDLYM